MTSVVSTNTGHPGASSLRGALQSIAVVLGLALTFLALGAGYGMARFGTISATLGYVRGERVLVDQPARIVTNAQPGSEIVVHYMLTNHSGLPVTFVGMKSSCTCTKVDDLPRALAVSESRTVSATITIAEDRKQTVSGSILLFTDSPEAPQISLAYQVSVAQTPTRQVP